MSRHRNMGGWVAETYEEEDYDDASHGVGGADELPINAFVMAKFYDENQWYPGSITDFSEYGYMVLFEGFEDEGIGLYKYIQIYINIIYKCINMYR